MLLNKVLCLGRGVRLGRDRAPSHTGPCPFPPLCSAPCCPRAQDTSPAHFRSGTWQGCRTGVNFCQVLISLRGTLERRYSISTQPGKPFESAWWVRGSEWALQVHQERQAWTRRSRLCWALCSWSPWSHKMTALPPMPRHGPWNPQLGTDGRRPLGTS